MNYWLARQVLTNSKKKCKKFNNVRFVQNGKEYKIVYEGGWVSFLTVYQRPAYTRKHFQYVDTFAEDDLYGKDILAYIKEKVA